MPALALVRVSHIIMNAEPLLNRIAKVLADHRLEVVMVGNAAAALHGAPVTTLDVDFMFRKTPTNLKKLKAVAKTLGATILRPYYPVSELYRVVNDERGLQLDFMAKLDGDPFVRRPEGSLGVREIWRTRAQDSVSGGYHQKQACRRPRPRPGGARHLAEDTR